jgi:hypothetical protein
MAQKVPTWAPDELVQLRNELLPKAQAEAERAKAGTIEIFNKRKSLEDGHFYIGQYFSAAQVRLKILDALIVSEDMRDVWRNLKRREHSFKPVFRSLLVACKTPASSLYGFCIEVEHDWLNMPKRTRAESKRLHTNIAERALQLTELLLEIEDGHLLDTRKYIDPEQLTHFKKGLEKDGHEDWYGFDGYLDYLLGEVLPPVPCITLRLHKRALECAEQPLAVKQPKSPNARVHYFVRRISAYFVRSYGQPLHSHVAAIVRAICAVNVDEDRVRALIRVTQKSNEKAIRNKLAKGRARIDG